MHATARSILESTSPPCRPITPALGGLSSAHLLQPRAPLPSTRLTALLTTLPKSSTTREAGSQTPSSTRNPHLSHSFPKINSQRKQLLRRLHLIQSSVPSPSHSPCAKQRSSRHLLIRIRNRLHRKSDRLSTSSFLSSTFDSEHNCASLRG
jgi:hypothetical protein